MPGKYEGAHEVRDEVLHWLCQDGWGNESTGDVQAPTGYVYRIRITEAELDEVMGAVERLVEGDVQRSLVGDFIIQETSDGFVHVIDCRTDEGVRTGEDRARVLFQAFERDYAAWLGQPE